MSMNTLFLRYTSFVCASVIFLLLTVVFGYLRQVYLARVWEYDLSGGDSVVSFAPYVFLLLLFFFRREQFKKTKIIRDQASRRLLWWGIAIAILFVPTMQALTPPIFPILLEYGLRFVMYLAVAAAVYGVAFLKEQKTDVALITLVGLITVLLPFVMDGYWHVFSRAIMAGLDVCFGILGIEHKITYATYTVQAQNFVVNIGAACAGLMMLMLFMLLYLLAAFLLSERQPLHRGRVLLYGILGLVGAIVVNFIRILLILLVGVYISEEIAITVFHANIGAILFMAIFGWYLSYLIKTNKLIVPSRPA